MAVGSMGGGELELDDVRQSHTPASFSASCSSSIFISLLCML